MYSRLLVPLDGSTTSRLALSHAAALARLCGASVVLLHVIEELEHCIGFEPPRIYIEEIRPRLLKNGQALLDEALQALQQQQVAARTVLLESGSARVAELIAQQAALTRADLIIMGTHGRRGVDRLLLGSDAEQVARLASVPVLLVRDHADAAAPATSPAQRAQRAQGPTS